MRTEDDDERRIKFERPLPIRIMSIDGTRCGEGYLTEISDRDAQIELTGYAGELTEFFLLLTRFGNPVFRHCRRTWVQGAQIGVSFARVGTGLKKGLPEQSEFDRRTRSA